MMFDKDANRKYKFGNRHSPAEGYYFSTVGLNKEKARALACRSVPRAFSPCASHSFAGVMILHLSRFCMKKVLKNIDNIFDLL